MPFIDEISQRFIAFITGRHREAIESTVFHYTSAEGLMGIISNGTFWLSNAAYLNDPAELSYPVELVNEVLRTHRLELLTPLKGQMTVGKSLDSERDPVFKETQEQHE